MPALTRLCDLISVATACGPAVSWAVDRLDGWQTTLVEDGFLFCRPSFGRIEDVRILYMAHLDEVGGLVLDRQQDGSGYSTLMIGVPPAALDGRALLAMDYDDETGATVRPCSGVLVDGELVLEGLGLRPYRTVFTFDESASAEGDWLYGKALDPRAAAFAVVEAARLLARPDVGLMLVFAEECSPLPAQKAVEFARDRLPALAVTVNCDVPGLPNVWGVALDECAVRITERGSIVDPRFSLRLYDDLLKAGCRISLATARSGSLTSFFSPLCHVLSIALPAEHAHLARTRVSLRALRDLLMVLQTIPDTPSAGREQPGRVWA